MLAVILGVIFIIAGVLWFMVCTAAAGMASRDTTAWEQIVKPSLGLIPAVLGAVILIWG